MVGCEAPNRDQVMPRIIAGWEKRGGPNGLTENEIATKITVPDLV